MLKTLTSKAETTEHGQQNIGPRGRIAFFKLVPTSRSRQQQPASHEGQMVFFNWSPCCNLAEPVTAPPCSPVLHTGDKKGLCSQLLASHHHMR